MSELFDGGAFETPVTVKSVGARRTERAQQMIAAGQHPANGLPIDPAHKCGNCAHLRVNPRASRTYFKCPHHRYGMSHSEASDMRASWPACPKFEAAPK